MMSNSAVPINSVFGPNLSNIRCSADISIPLSAHLVSQYYGKFSEVRLAFVYHLVKPKDFLLNSLNQSPGSLVGDR